MLKKSLQIIAIALILMLTASVAMADDVGRISEYKAGTVQTTNPEVDIIQDGSFEGGTPNSAWNEGSTNFGTPLCDAISCGTGGGTTGPRTGAWWAWFGGIDTTEVGFVEQTITMTPGNNGVLSFWLWNGAVGNAGVDDFNVQIDGTMIFQVFDGDATYTGGYTEVVLDISSYADGSPHVLRFESTTVLTGETTNFSLDDVVLDETTPTDVSLTSFNMQTSWGSYFWILGLILIVIMGGLVKTRFISRV